MHEPENQIASQFPFTSATETTNLNSNYPEMSPLQLSEEHTEHLFGFQPIHRELAPAAAPSAHEEIPPIQNYPEDHFIPGTIGQWPSQATMTGPSSEFEGGLPPVPLPAPRSEVWTTAQENHLKESKRNGKTYPEIRHSMWVAFGIDRSVNVLSKRHRMMLERDAKDNVITKFLNGALPNLMQCLEDEVNKVDPELIDEELRRDVHAKLRRTFPKYVRSLALEKKSQ